MARKLSMTHGNVLSAVCLLILTLSLATGAYIKETTESETEICTTLTPCAWEVYRRTSKDVVVIDYYMPSPCQCPEGTRCVRSADDISIGTFVHHCRTDEVGEWPEVVHSSDSGSPTIYH